MKLSLKRLRCQVCGAKIPPGGIFYISRTEIISGSDGILPETEESADRMIADALQEMAKSSERQLMEEVYQEIKLILCGRCRLDFRDRILAMISY